MRATENEINSLNLLYENRFAVYGDLHNHSASGGTSDGRCPLSYWRERMKVLGFDFAAILDHRQVRHMYLDEWEDGIFLGGTEPGTNIVDLRGTNSGMHYNMLFENAKPLEKLLEKFPEFEFEGGVEGHFTYPDFTRARMCELIEEVHGLGGFFVYPHPKLIMDADDPLEYFFANETGFEVIYLDAKSEDTEKNYALWCTLLDMGKRLFACAGEDRHGEPSVDALTTVYAKEKKNKEYLKHLRAGDFVCGSVGIKMCIGDCVMGGRCRFEGKRLTVSVSDFHPSVLKDGHEYELWVLRENTVVEREKLSQDRENIFSYDISPCAFYRAEVVDATENIRIAIGNPIWKE